MNNSDPANRDESPCSAGAPPATLSVPRTLQAGRLRYKGSIVAREGSIVARESSIVARESSRNEYAECALIDVMRLLALRHGESIGNKELRLQGRADFPLSERGLEQAALAGQYLATFGWPIAECYASPLKRAQVTAETVCGHLADVPLTIVPLLAEMSAGALEGQTWEALKTVDPPFYGRSTADWLNYATWGGMTQMEYFDPIHAWLDATFPEESLIADRTVLIVAHAVTLRALIAWGLSDRTNNHIGLHFGNCTLAVVNVHAGLSGQRRTLEAIIPTEHQALLLGSRRPGFSPSTMQE